MAYLIHENGHIEEISGRFNFVMYKGEKYNLLEMAKITNLRKERFRTRFYKFLDGKMSYGEMVTPVASKQRIVDVDGIQYTVYDIMEITGYSIFKVNGNVIKYLAGEITTEELMEPKPKGKERSSNAPKIKNKRRKDTEALRMANAAHKVKQAEYERQLRKQYGLR